MLQKALYHGLYLILSLIQLVRYPQYASLRVIQTYCTIQIMFCALGILRCVDTCMLESIHVRTEHRPGDLLRYSQELILSIGVIGTSP